MSGVLNAVGLRTGVQCSNVPNFHVPRANVRVFLLKEGQTTTGLIRGSGEHDKVVVFFQQTSCNSEILMTTTLSATRPLNNTVCDVTASATGGGFEKAI